MGCALASAGSGSAAASSKVWLTAPASSAVVSSTISLSCSVPSTVKWINLDIDENYYASAPDWASSYTTAWNSKSVPNGSHQVECNGYASDGSMVGASVANIIVSNGVVQLTAPANDAVVSGTITLSCTVPSTVRWINLDIDENYYASAPDWASSYTTAWSSASVYNGSHQVECNGYGSNGSLIGASAANINVNNGGNSPPPTPTPASTTTPTATPTPVGCKNIPGTNTPVGAPCFPSSSYPSLKNPEDPINYGADKTGVNDSTAAINAALSAGDVYFKTPGTYLVNQNNGLIIPPAGRAIECAHGVTLVEQAENGCSGHDCGILTLYNGGNTVVGCDFQGGNSAMGAVPIGSNGGQFLIMVASNNDIIEGNTFENAWGNSAVQVNGDNGTVPANFLIQYNTFLHNPYYGPEVDVASSGIIQNNMQTDGGIGPEDDACSGSYSVNNVTIRNNELVTSVGDCRVAGQSGCDGDAFITGGSYPPGCNYSTVTVQNNYCQGNATQGVQIENVGSGVTPASYNNDILGQSCSCRSGSGC
jgi:hypothetical protein